MKFAWIDLRTVPPELREPVAEAAVHARLDAVVDDRLDLLAALPPTVRKVYFPVESGEPPSRPDGVDLVVRRVRDRAGLAEMARRTDDLVAYVEVSDHETLELACACAATLPHTVVRFTDPTKIPLEIVIAAADGASGQLVTETGDLDEAAVVLGCLEKGSDGILHAPADLAELTGLIQLLRAGTAKLDLVELTVTSVAQVGLGDRVCVDTCSHFAEDEGILVGSFASGFILCCSETHPLPYMPTRPFRVNAGALHSYVVQDGNRTSYLSDLRSGGAVLAVRADGSTRTVALGRAKLETRPLRDIRAVAPDGTEVGLILQDDWHVRVLGPGAEVLNITELRPGDRVLGHLAEAKRHVGYPVDEYCLER